MARLSTTGAATPDTSAIDLTRLLARLQNTLLNPDGATERRLRTSSYERQKVQTNIEYARTLLLRLEQDAINIKIQSRKQDVQTDLLKKRDIIVKLIDRLQEINSTEQDSTSDSSEGEDLLAEDTPSASDDIDGHDTPPEEQPPPSPTPQPEHFPYSPSTSQPSARDELFPSALRARHAADQVDPSTDQSYTTSSSISPSDPSTKLTETLLTHNRSEQETLTNSLLNMATALKAKSVEFANTLEDEKDTLDRASDGLERNTSGMEAAQKRMGYLRRMSEGQGWLGRIMLYVWIFGLMLLALFIVGFTPKLRF